MCEVWSLGRICYFSHGCSGWLAIGYARSGVKVLVAAPRLPYDRPPAKAEPVKVIRIRTNSVRLGEMLERLRAKWPWNCGTNITVP